MKKMRNITKDKIFIIAFLCFIFFVASCLSLLFVFAIKSITKLNAEEIKIELTEQQQINKFYTEERIKAEMYYLSACDCIENMSDEEYNETFFMEA